MEEAYHDLSHQTTSNFMELFLLQTAKLCNIIRAVAIRQFRKIVNLILLTSTNRQNTGSGAFHRRDSIKHIIRVFSKAVLYIKPI